VYQHVSHYREQTNQIPKFKLGDKRKAEDEGDRPDHQSMKQAMLDERRRRLGMATSNEGGADDSDGEGTSNNRIDAQLIIPVGYADSSELLRRLKEKQAALRPKESEEEHAKRIAKIQAALREKKRRSKEAREHNKLVISSKSVVSSVKTKSAEHDSNASDDDDDGGEGENVMTAAKAEKTQKKKETNDKKPAQEEHKDETKKKEAVKYDFSFGEIRSPTAAADEPKTTFTKRVGTAQHIKSKVEELRKAGKEEEANQLLQKIKLENALERARSGKDVALLDEKMVKKREKKIKKLKKASQEEWKKREDAVAKQMAERQRKRAENISKKIETKIAKQKGTYKKEKKGKGKGKGKKGTHGKK